MALMDDLNKYLGEQCGLLTNGKPEYAWQWGPSMPYWGANLGPRWVMCKWELPKESADWWLTNFGDKWVYPEGGYYKPYVDSALSHGSIPTWHLTQNYAWAINKQRSTTEIQQCVDVENDIAAHHHQREVAFRQMVQDEAPAFGNCKSVTALPGDKPHVVFGGLLDSKGEVAVAADTVQ